MKSNLKKYTNRNKLSIYKILKKQRFVNRNGDLSRFLAGIQVGCCKKKF